MKHIRAANWVAEVAEANENGFRLLGSSLGYGTFRGAFSTPQDIWYSAADEYGNREAGYGYFDGSNISDRTPTATLVGGKYTATAPKKVGFRGQVTISCTFNSAAFNLLWESLQALDPEGDGNINIPPELIDGLVESLREKADQVDLDAEIEARIAGDEDLQQQIDDLSVDASNFRWDQIKDKPESISALGYQNTVDGGTYNGRYK